jgi:ethanolamine utilization protein EutN
MLRAKVIGRAIATIKHPSLEGRTMLIVQPLLNDGLTPDGDPLLAVDGVGAGRGETVVITSDGRGAREMLGVEATPVRWTTIGISDECP